MVYAGFPFLFCLLATIKNMHVLVKKDIEIQPGFEPGSSEF